MIDGLGKALIYAHEHSIVHSDFKPGNCFQTKEGVMKVLDFGIARAVKNPGQGEGEKTLFDPGKLGALTPAYASAEMLEGEEPDPRDSRTRRHKSAAGKLRCDPSSCGGRGVMAIDRKVATKKRYESLAAVNDNPDPQGCGFAGLPGFDQSGPATRD